MMKILNILARKDPNAARQAMWEQLENTKKILFNATYNDFEFTTECYLFAESANLKRLGA